MAAGKEIRTKISSIRSTQKITSAMEMVAASKMRKAQDRMQLGKPYARRMRSVVGHLANAAPEYKHMYMETREVKRVGYIVVSTDRGLCGGLNMNLFKTTVRSMKEWSNQDVEVDLSLIGAKAVGFFGSLGGNITAAVRDLGEEPSLASLIGGVKAMLDAYEEGKIDRLDVAYTEFVSASRQQAAVHSLLPIGVLAESVKETETAQKYDYEFLPSAQEILEEIVPTAFKARLFKCFLDAAVSEQIARMVAMKGATENANEMVGTLSAQYNRARQSQITSEILEIIGGAAALE